MRGFVAKRPVECLVEIPAFAIHPPAGPGARSYLFSFTIDLNIIRIVAIDCKILLFRYIKKTGHVSLHINFYCRSRGILTICTRGVICRYPPPTNNIMPCSFSIEKCFAWTYLGRGKLVYHRSDGCSGADRKSNRMGAIMTHVLGITGLQPGPA